MFNAPPPNGVMVPLAGECWTVVVDIFQGKLTHCVVLRKNS